MELYNDFTGFIRLSSGHSLILGHKPESLKPEQIVKKAETERKSTLNFGLFDHSAPNYTTYYPDVSAEDLNPKEEDFIFPVFRALSSTIISKYIPIDFSEGNILRDSMQKLVGQTINIDHEIATGNAIGTVKEVFWQKAYTTDSGIEVPAGINAVFMIDGKSNPRIARGIMMNPPSIHSDSVGIRFKWKPSHEFEEPSEFWNKVGGFDEDGVLIRAIVSEIIAYTEISLVPHGADVFAQKTEDGKIINPEYAESVYQFNDDKTGFTGNVFVDYKDIKSFFNFSKNETIPNKLNTNQEDFKSKEKMKITKEELKKLASNFGLKEEELTADNYIEKLIETHSGVQTSLKEFKDNEQAVKNDRASLKEYIDTKVKAKDIPTLELEAKVGKEYAIECRTEALRLYKLCNKGSEDSNIIKLINESDVATAKSFKEQYEKEASEKFKVKCECGKDLKNFNGIPPEDQLELIDEDGEKGPKSESEVRSSFRNRRRPSRVIKTQSKDNKE